MSTEVHPPSRPIPVGPARSAAAAGPRKSPGSFTAYRMADEAFTLRSTRRLEAALPAGGPAPLDWLPRGKEVRHA